MQKEKKRFMIRQIFATKREDCCEIEEISEVMALYAYGKCLTAADGKSMADVNGRPHLFTSYGAEFEAVRI